MTYHNGGEGIDNLRITTAHEVGHIFYALDEYKGTGGLATYDDFSGYYNIRNTNAYDRNPNQFKRVASIMAAGGGEVLDLFTHWWWDLPNQENAYKDHTTSKPSREMVGWKNTGNTGILDVLDTPLTLSVTGHYEGATNSYVIRGTSSVTALKNLNPQTSEASRTDITLNTVDRVQYRINNGSWATLSRVYGGHTAAIDEGVSLAGMAVGRHTIYFRTRCDRTGVVSKEQSFDFTVWEETPFEVTTLSDTNEATSLRRAISLAGTPGWSSTIIFHPSLHGKTIVLNGYDLVINRSMTIDGTDANITIDANRRSRVFRVDSGSVALTGLTVTGGYSPPASPLYPALGDSGGGGGIYVGPDAMLTLTNCTITENAFRESQPTNNVGPGGGIYNRGRLTVTNSEISRNMAAPRSGLSDHNDNGGGICNSGLMTITNCEIFENGAPVGGGIANRSGGTLVVINSKISDNGSSGLGSGGISNKGTLTLTNSVISGNDGFGIDNDGDTTFSGNTMLTVTNCTIAGNRSGICTPDVLPGLYDPRFSLNNSIVAQNTGFGDIYYTTTPGGGVNRTPGYNNLTSFTGWDDTSGNNCLYNPAQPLFVNAATGDYRLAPGSQAIDKGSNALAYAAGLDADLLDMAGSPRFFSAAIDIGAYEAMWQETPSTIVTILDDIVDEYDGLISLRETIAYANPGDTITFASSLFGKTIVLNGNELYIDKDITIDATGFTRAGGTNITIDANQKSSVFHVASSATVELIGLTITGGFIFEDDGGGIFNAGVLTVKDCTITGNFAGWGGGIYNDGTLTVMDSTISDNWAFAGGGIYNFGALTVSSSTISDNEVEYGGGGIINEGASGMTLIDSTVTNNSAGWAGGIFSDAPLTITNSTISGNVASEEHGGAFNDLINLETLDEEHEWVVSKIVEPTCTEEGYTVYVCKCGEGESFVGDYTEPIDHDWVPVNVPATCVGAGYTGEVCRHCEIWQNHTVLNPPGHDFDWDTPVWNGEAWIVVCVVCRETECFTYDCGVYGCQRFDNPVNAEKVGFAKEQCLDCGEWHEYQLAFDDAEVDAVRVEQLNGNQNRLWITVLEVYEGFEFSTSQSFMIANNSAGTYTVSKSKVYVDTKGNTQIRECYIVP